MNPGKAYGFLYCSASKQEIEAELPSLRDHAQTPSQLELVLIESIDNLGDSKLNHLAQKAKEQGINYLLEATYPHANHKATANELADILNQAYQSSLYQAGEPFNGAVVYELDGEYVFRE